MATWGAIPENPFFTLPARVAKEVIAPVPRSDPDLPGPFALREPARGLAILETAGFGHPTVDELHLMLTPAGDATKVAELLCDVGPAQKALSYHEADAARRDALVTALSEALSVYETPEGLRIPALINIFTARKAA